LCQPAWDNAGSEVGVLVWRIEKFHVKVSVHHRCLRRAVTVNLLQPVAKETYGSFFSGDSYIVLQTYKKADKICWNIFFWLGDHTTQGRRCCFAVNNER
jgi:gelsolin